MPRDLLPSTGALTAFECAARHLSFSRAAAELHLTQGAISRQVRQLEDKLGIALFERINQRVVLTDAGASYLADVGRILGELSTATQRAMASAGSAEVLNLAVLSTFAARWLVPRLPAFLARAPGAMVNFSVRNAPFSFADDRLDAAIHHGEGSWPGAVCEFLCVEEVFPVAAPALRDRLGLAAETDIVGAPLLHQSTRPTAWRDWFAAFGLPDAGAFRGAQFDEFAMIAEAAVAGLGVALMPTFLIEAELGSGRLVRLSARPQSNGRGYWFVYPQERAGARLVRLFGDWLREAAATPPRG